MSPFQEQMRDPDAKQVKDHMVKKYNPLVEKRFELIPITSGSDWRDLPNDVVRLSDGTFSKVLVYKVRLHFKIKQSILKKSLLMILCV